jgi:aldose 1-epimerase
LSFTPSGEQFELHWGGQRAIVVEVGGGLRSYEAAGRTILDGYGAQERCSGARGQVLTPWPNRLRDGTYEWDGASHQLDISEPALNNAIHGLVRWRNWTAKARELHRVVLAHVLHPQPGYPFAISLEIAYELSDRGLGVTTTARNIGVQSAPYGVGFHPYLLAPGSDRINESILTLPAETRLLTDAGAIPEARTDVANGPFDFRMGRVVDGMVLDTCYTDLERDSSSAARIVLASAGGQTTTLWLDPAYRFVMAYSGDTLPRADRRRGLAIEPMTCAPNAFQSGDGLVTLQPGEVHTARWGLEAA